MPALFRVHTLLLQICTVVIALWLLPAPASAAPGLKLVSHTMSATLPKVQPDWPVPRDGHQVFYIQRSMNSNTVVYAARFDESGHFDRNTPVHGYWRRYNTDGVAKSLKFIEKQFAYGVSSRVNPDGETYAVTFKAIPHLSVTLRSPAPNRASLWAQVGDTDLQLTYAYLDLDESGLIPKVTRLRLFGTDPATGRAHTLIFSVSGGAIRE
ncbi:protein of unknown function [Salinihabitans flavidus]|uniref:DUF4833 domain-containing protein n=1 Tax=Salinihabitans flavidus TaxID=569882 RepID=A0A1H8QUY8_9RHOB|nr:DUF4833 domain-containing protein [Salinihabitans flavidus]SEO57867.1 protein of unknown function [Salinihabitans flavidus]